MLEILNNYEYEEIASTYLDDFINYATEDFF